jgi:peptidoglycan-associated lipoprotein
MRFKIIALAAAMTVLAGCADKAQTGADAGGTNTGIGGGPAVAAVGSLQAQLVQVGDRIFFAFDKSDITPESKATLERQAALFQANPSVTFTVEGHCDERGTREYNLALGERRATSDKNALVALGIQASRIQTISYGKERPAVVGSNEAAWAQNRRAVAVIN